MSVHGKKEVKTPIMIRRLLTLIAASTALWGGPAQADPLAICRAGNPQFPQLCECAVARAQAAGIEGTVLDRLLANQWDGVPMDVANRYGLIFVECTQAAVAGGAMALPSPPAQDHDIDVTHGGDAVAAPDVADPSDPPVLAAIPADGSLPGVPAGYQITLDAAPGTWGGARLDTPFGQSLVQAVRNAEGRHLALRCTEPGALPIVMLGPFEDGVPGQGAQIVVLGSGGLNGRLFQQGTQLMGVNRTYLATSVTSPQFLDALRRGNTVEVRLEDGRTEAFGLRGSSRAIGQSACQIGRISPSLYPMGWEATRHDPWQRGQAQYRNRITDALFLPGAQSMSPHLALTCDRRLISQSRVSSYDGTLTGEIVLSHSDGEEERFSVPFEVGGYSAASPVLSPELLNAMTRADTMALTFDVNAPPGGGGAINTTMAGFAEGLPDLACAAEPGTALAGGGRDLTGAGEWVTERIEAFTDEPYDVAMFAVEGAPTLFVTCKGEPSVLGIFTPTRPPDLNLSLQVDGDPSRTVESTFTPYRAGAANMGEGRERIAPSILQGRSLRITNLYDPSESFLYPLDGLRAAIAAMPPPCRF